MAAARGIGFLVGRGMLILALLGVWGCLVLAGGVAWYYQRPQPPLAARALQPGVSYTRHVIASPQPQVIHVVTANLRQPGLRWDITAPLDADPSHAPLEAHSVSYYVRATGAVVAINGSYFQPWDPDASGLPEDGDPVAAMGVALSQGIHYAATSTELPILYRTPRGTGFGFTVPPDATTAISGYPTLLEAGVSPFTGEVPHYWLERHPRTAVGLSQDGETLFLVVCDGRQPHYAEGLTLPELAAFMKQIGAYHALNLDGGGSSSLVVNSWLGPRVVNAPIHHLIPGNERPVANHIGIFVE